MNQILYVHHSELSPPVWKFVAHGALYNDTETEQIVKSYKTRNVRTKVLKAPRDTRSLVSQKP